MWRKLTQFFARWQAYADRNARRLAEFDAYDKAHPSPPSKVVAGMREAAGAITTFFGVAITVALVIAAALLALWGLVALVKFFWEHS